MDWIDELFEETPKAEAWQQDLIEELLLSSVISPEENDMLYNSISNLNYQEAEDLIIYLKTKQVERISAGLNYNMTYLNKFLKKTI